MGLIRTLRHWLLGDPKPFGDPLFGPFNGSLDDLLISYRIVKTITRNYTTNGKQIPRKIRTVKKEGFTSEQAAQAHMKSLNWTEEKGYSIEPYKIN